MPVKNTQTMKKFKVQITRIEKFYNTVVVEAKSARDAKKKVMEQWEEDDYLYEKTTDNINDSRTSFKAVGEANDIDENKFMKL